MDSRSDLKKQSSSEDPETLHHQRHQLTEVDPTGWGKSHCRSGGCGAGSAYFPFCCTIFGQKSEKPVQFTVINDMSIIAIL